MRASIKRARIGRRTGIVDQRGAGVGSGLHVVVVVVEVVGEVLVATGVRVGHGDGLHLYGTRAGGRRTKSE